MLEKKYGGILTTSRLKMGVELSPETLVWACQVCQVVDNDQRDIGFENFFQL
jgi:hypothetical protein